MARSKVNGASRARSSAEEALDFYQSAVEKQPIPADTPAYKDIDSLAYEISRVPMRLHRPIKVICCGAGFSGLNFAHEVESGRIPNCTLQIYEKNSSLGGTWFENRYPGSVIMVATTRSMQWRY